MQQNNLLPVAKLKKKFVNHEKRDQQWWMDKKERKKGVDSY